MQHNLKCAQEHTPKMLPTPLDDSTQRQMSLQRLCDMYDANANDPRCCVTGQPLCTPTFSTTVNPAFNPAFRNATLNHPVLQVQLLCDTARAPTKAHEHDAGYDLYAAEEAQLGCEQALTPETPDTRCQLKLFRPVPKLQATHALVRTGVAVAIPLGYYGRVASRSGLSVKHCVEVGAGVVDAGYRGEILVHLYSHGGAPLHIKPGDRIAQLIITPCASPDVQVVDTLPASTRGASGFGSSGK